MAFKLHVAALQLSLVVLFQQECADQARDDTPTLTPAERILGHDARNPDSGSPPSVAKLATRS
jgi:hypothetical protein